MWESIYNVAKESNGFQNIKMYIHKKTFKLIPIKDIYSGLIPISDYRILQHVGYKMEINYNIWIFGLFTSKQFTMINDIIIQNIAMFDNVFKYVNPPMFINNDLFSRYIEIDDRLEQFPKYIKDEIKLHKTIEEGLDTIANDAKKAYTSSLYASDFNNPITLIEQYHNAYMNKENIISNKRLIYKTNEIQILRDLELKNEDIYHLVENLLKGKNIWNEDLFKTDHIKWKK